VFIAALWPDDDRTAIMADTNAPPSIAGIPVAPLMPSRVPKRAASTTPEWDLSTLAPAQRLAVLAGFFVAYAFLASLGYVLKESALALTILWPAAGLLFVTLVLTPFRQWPWIVALQVAAELVVGYLYAHRLELGWTSLFMLGNSCDGLVGALIVKRWINDPTMPRLVQVAKVIAASAIGAAAGALGGELAGHARHRAGHAHVGRALAFPASRRGNGRRI
jgi:hypothetical protein